MINLSRPLAFFDLETTGTTIGHDRIIEISILKILPGGGEETLTHRINPEMNIPEIITQITGISNEDVKGKPKLTEVGEEIKKFIEGCDLAGYNSNKFDIPFLVEELARVGIDLAVRERKLIDVQNIFHKMEPRTLSAAYKFYCDQELINAHSADADTRATYEIFKAQVERYPDLEGKDLDYLHKFTNMHNTVDLAGRLVYNDKEEVIVNFGKHKGKLLTEVFTKEPSYYDWIQRGDFSRETKAVFRNLWDEFQKSKLAGLQQKFNAK